VDKNKTLIVMDVDTGIDDALALILALRAPEAEVLAIGTVAGNIEAGQAATNTLKVLDVVGVNVASQGTGTGTGGGAGAVPVAVGLNKPLVRPLRTAPHVHGSDGMGDAGLAAPRGQPSGEHAVDQLVRLAHERRGEITLVATGPLTNVAAALILAPDLPRLLKGVVIMGGAADGIGNRTPVAEANIWHDPEAARLVFEAGWPSFTMVGLDVTMTTLLRRPQLDLLRAATPAQPVARFVAAIVAFYWERYTRLLGVEGCALHDPLALGIALDPSLVTEFAAFDVLVETEGALTAGMTVADRRPLRGPGYPRPRHPIGVPLAVDADRFVARLMRAFLE